MPFKSKQTKQEVESPSSPKSPKSKPIDGKDLLEVVGKVQQKRDSVRKSKKKKALLPPQASKQPGEDEDQD
jgi:hypothetical protein